MAGTMPWEDYSSAVSGTVPPPIIPQGGPPTPPTGASSAQEDGPWNDFATSQASTPVSAMPTNDALGAAVKGFAQGITFNSADEIDAALTAAKRALVNGGDFSKEYADKLAYNRQSDAQDASAHPIANVAGNIAGGVALTPVLPGLTAESMAGQIGQSALQGAGLGAAYGFGGEQGGVGNRIGGAVQGGLVGGAVGAAAPVVAAGLQRLVSGPAKQITSGEIKNLAQAQYQKADELGGMLSPKVTNDFIADATKNLRPQTQIGQALAGDSEASRFADVIGKYAGKSLNLAEAQDIDEAMTNAISKEYGLKGLSKDGKNLLDLQTSFRNMIENATPENGGVVGGKDGFEALKYGRQLWSQAAKVRDIESIINKAELSEQPANAIRSGFKSLASNPARLRGYDKNTQYLIRKAARTGIVGEGLRFAGSRLLSTIAGSGAGLAAGGPLGALGGAAVAQGTGIVARKAGEALARGRANQVIQSIAGDLAPEAAQTVNGLIQPLTAAGAAATAPSPRPIRIPVYPSGMPANGSQQPAPGFMPQSLPANMMPAVSSISQSVIDKEEGTTPKAIVDTTGNKTVGTGFNMDQPNARSIWAKANIPEDFEAVYNGEQTLSPESNAKIFTLTSHAAQKAVSKMVPNYDQLGDNQKAALTSLAFQLGGKGLSKFKALDYLAQGNAKAVENSILGTLFAKQAPARARREALMLAYDMSHEEADRQLASQGRIKPTQRKYL